MMVCAVPSVQPVERYRKANRGQRAALFMEMWCCSEAGGPWLNWMAELAWDPRPERRQLASLRTRVWGGAAKWLTAASVAGPSRPADGQVESR